MFRLLSATSELERVKDELTNGKKTDEELFRVRSNK